jgi:hypothetical protein
MSKPRDDIKGSMLCPRTLCLWRSGESLPDFHCFHTWRGNVPMTGRYLCLFCNHEAIDREYYRVIPTAGTVGEIDHAY